MLSVLIGLVIGLVLIYCYRLGLKDGIRVADNKPLQNLSPLDKYRKYKQEQKEEKHADAFITGLNNVLAYDGNPQPEDEVK
jgi:hypothetical protein